MNPDSSPENLHHRIVVMPVEISLWKFIQAGCTDHIFVPEELVTAANAEMRKKKGDEIIKN